MITRVSQPGENAEGAWAGTRGLWRVAGLCLTGPGHKVCEDATCARFNAAGGLHVAVADGVSQGACGDLAARTLAEHCATLPPDAGQSDFGSVARWLESGEAAVQRAVAAVTPLPGAATMAAAWLDGGGRGFLSHVGDCRIYRWRPQRGGIHLRVLTRDQSYCNLGEAAPPDCPPNNPARMVGIGKLGRPEIQALELLPGDGLLLCSDGLHCVLDGPELADALADSWSGARRDHALAILGTHVARLARARGSRDDIAVVLLQWGCA